MSRVAKKLRAASFLAGLCGLLATGAAWTAPPGLSVAPHPHAGAARGGFGLPARAVGPASGLGAATGRLSTAAPLDLSLPDSTASHQTGPARPGTIQLKDPDYRSTLPALGVDAVRREPSRIEELALRVHREGVPLARLWQNENALLHLGLNSRGKPGLWLVQKIH